ncbi:aminotransferase class I/II-fold pyridoxal phosphate-dependent enzyme [Amycolatopsis thailandensis]|uniref:aminotransferase class I/II-fold pyridoxal phosphate-dependent enzyme n=1 Tax=Amycolatopsis thailandensis TaxID=589330 RepID=UPI003792E189
MTALSDDQRSLGSFSGLRGRHLLDRLAPFDTWRRDHARNHRWGYHQQMLTRPVTWRPRVRDQGRGEHSGVSLISQDYLALSTHPAVREAILEALDVYGPHSAGSPAAAGTTVPAQQLCEQLAELLGMREVVLFPSGWAAGFGAVNAFVRRGDHVIVDELSHACLHEGIAASRSRDVIRVPHLDNDAVREALRDIRRKDADNGILVITESLFSMNSDTPDLRRLQELCREHDAVLLVDQAHDIGAMGPGGLGQAAAQGVRGDLDIVVGAFSKVFATNGGYLATNSEAVAQYVRHFSSPHMFSSALTPLQAAGALAAAKIVTSPEGQRRRDDVLRNSHVLRDGLTGTAGAVVLGEPSPIVPLEVDSISAGRRALRLAEEAGVLLHLVEFPIVARGRARFRLQLSSAHEPDDLADAAKVLVEAVEAAHAPSKMTTTERNHS